MSARSLLLCALSAALVCGCHAWRPGAFSHLLWGRSTSKAEEAQAMVTYPSWPGGPPGSDYDDVEGKKKKKHHHHNKPPGPSYPGWPAAPKASDVVAPAYPGWGPTPSPSGGDELPLTNGMVVTMYSHTLDRYCNVADADAPVPYALTCDGDSAPSVIQGILLLGTDFTTNKLYDGSRVQLKSQLNNKLCSVGAEDDGFPVTCGDMDVTDSSDFVIRRAAARDDLYYLAPAFIPSHHCYPAGSPSDHGGVLGVSLAAGAADAAEGKRTHAIQCNGHHDGDNALFQITQAPYWGPTPGGPGGGGAPAWPSGPSSVLTAAASSPAAGYPYFPGFPYPYAPAGPPAGPVLPFGMGSTIQLISPDLPELLCDVKDASWGPGGSGAAAGDAAAGGQVDKGKGKKKGGGDSDEKTPVTCDRAGPQGPGSQFAPAGFLVVSKDPAARQLESGAELALSSLATRKACRRKSSTAEVVCDAQSTEKDAQWRVYLAAPSGGGGGGGHQHHHHKHHHHKLVQAVLDLPGAVADWAGRLAAKLGWRAPAGGADAGGDSPVDAPLEVHLLHVASDRWCGPDDDKHETLICDHKSESHRPRIWVKVSSPWPPITA